MIQPARGCATLMLTVTVLVGKVHAQGETPRTLWADFEERASLSSRSAPGLARLLLFDLNGDGRDELLLTHAQVCDGSGSCAWFVYSPLAVTGRVFYLGAITFAPARFRLLARPASICACWDQGQHHVDRLPTWREQCYFVDFDELVGTEVTECQQNAQEDAPVVGAKGVHLVANDVSVAAPEPGAWLEVGATTTHRRRIPDVSVLRVQQEPDSTMMLELAAKLERKDERFAAFHKLQKWRGAAAPAIPSLLCLVEEEIQDSVTPHGGDSDLREAAATLSAIGSETIPAVLAVLNSPCDRAVGRTADGRPCNLSLTAGADEADRAELCGWVRWTLVEALSGLDPSLVPELIEAFGQAGLGRPYLAAALGSFGERAAAAVPLLVEGLRAAEPSLRLQCVRALERIGPAAKDALPTLRMRINDPDPRVQRAASRAIQTIESLEP